MIRPGREPKMAATVRSRRNDSFLFRAVQQAMYIESASTSQSRQPRGSLWQQGVRYTPADPGGCRSRDAEYPLPGVFTAVAVAPRKFHAPASLEFSLFTDASTEALFTPAGDADAVTCGRVEEEAGEAGASAVPAPRVTASALRCARHAGRSAPRGVTWMC